jgi:hypothetical protein
MEKSKKRITSPSWGNKRGTSGKKKKKVVQPYISKYPPVDFDPKHPDIKVNLRLVSPKVDTGQNMEIIISTGSPLLKLAELINEKNNNACKNIVFYNETRENTLNKLMHMTFQQLGLSGELSLYYEFMPTLHPILEAGLV